MRALESLFEFMPYGAPDLLQSRRERLAGATLVSSLAIAALFLAAGSVARLVVVPPVKVPLPEFTPHVLERLPVPDSPAPPSAAPRTRLPGITDVPVPVPAPEVPVEVAPGPAVDHGVPGPQSVAGEPDQADIAPMPEALPGPEDYVWTEQLPEPVKVIKPEYPEIARQAGVEGLVIVKALVGKDGRVLDVRLHEKRQVPLLNEVALAAARAWRFTPALANGRAVAVWTTIPFHFRLHD